MNLTGAYGAEAAALSSLFTSQAAAWRFGAGSLQPLIGLKAIECAGRGGQGAARPG